MSANQQQSQRKEDEKGVKAGGWKVVMLNQVYGRKPRCGEKGKEDDFSLKKIGRTGGCSGVRGGGSPGQKGVNKNQRVGTHY